MAFAAGTIFHGWSSGATSNGGGFDPTCAGMLADLTTDANTANTTAPVVSSASYNFAAGDAGAKLFIQSGTNWTPGWYDIVSVASNKATLTASIGSAVKYGTSSIGANYQRPNGLNTAAGCATVGTPTGGVFAIDYSQQTGGISYTDLAIDASTNTDATSAAKPFSKVMLGNIWNVTSGTGFTVQRAQLVSIPSGVVGRFDKSLGTTSSTGGNATMGGAVGSTSVATALTLSLVAGNKVFLKGTFTVTSTTTATTSAKGDTTSGRISVEGFTSYPGQRDGRAIITSSTNSVALVTLNDNDFWDFIHLKFTHTAGTRGVAVNPVTSNSTPLFFVDCICDGCLTFFGSGASIITVSFEGVEVLNTTSATSALFSSASAAASTFLCWGCDFHDNAAVAVVSNASLGILQFDECIFDTNTIAISYSSASGSPTIRCRHCTFVDNSSDAIKIAATSGTSVTLELDSNVFYGNGGYGIDNLDEQAVADANTLINRNNAFGTNTSGNYTGIKAGFGEITLSGDPFANRASRDFTPDSTAGEGLALRAAAFPTTYPGGTSPSYRDVGAVQHQDSGGSGGVTSPTWLLGSEGVRIG